MHGLTRWLEGSLWGDDARVGGQKSYFAGQTGATRLELRFAVVDERVLCSVCALFHISSLERETHSVHD